MKVVVVGLLTIMVVAVVLLLLGFPSAAWAVGNAGTLLFLLGVMAWIGISDPMKKWPGASVFQRVANVMTFKR